MSVLFERTRSRASSLGHFQGQYSSKSSGMNPPLDYWWKSWEVTHDSTNPEWSKIGRFRDGSWWQGHLDAGSPFDSLKVSVSRPNVVDWNGYKTFLSNWTRYTGPVWASPEPYLRGKFGLKTDVELTSHDAALNQVGLGPYGATAMARVRPTDPSVSVAQTLGELKEGLPTPDDILRQQSLAKKLASGNLSWQFAIKPLLSDLENYREAYDTSAKTIDQWRRDSERRVRRRYRFPTEESETTEVKTNVYPQYSTGYPLTRYGTMTKVVKTVSNIWFSGAFKYYVPESSRQWVRTLQDYDRVYGIVPDLSTGWELLPFSWLVDWQTNAGDVISNISALGSDGCFLVYGYVMRHTRVVETYTWEGLAFVNQVETPVKLTDTVISDRKQRASAEPFGIGFTGDELSLRQKGILASLGVLFTR